MLEKEKAYSRYKKKNIHYIFADTHLTEIKILIFCVASFVSNFTLFIFSSARIFQFFVLGASFDFQFRAHIEQHCDFKFQKVIFFS